jgi:hypothetical protein
MPARPRALVMPLAAPISAAWPARVLAPPERQAPTLKIEECGGRRRHSLLVDEVAS